MDEKEEAIKEYRKVCIDYENKKLRALEKLKKFQPVTVPDNVVKSRVCFVFSCPGDKELINGQICSGATGENLNTLLKILKASNPGIFNLKDRYQYTILNASDIVHFKDFDGKTEAYKSEIMKEANLHRIEDIFQEHTEIKFVVLFGEKAKLLIDKIKEFNHNLKIATTRHLGYQSINQIENDKNNNPIEDNDPQKRTEKRLDVIAQEIIRQLGL